MAEIKNSSKQDVPFIFLKWLVIVMSIVMVLGFLFLVTILCVKIYKFNTASPTVTESSVQDLLISKGKIESVSINDNLLTIVVKVDANNLEVFVIDTKDGLLINQYYIKQKKAFIMSDYNPQI